MVRSVRLRRARGALLGALSSSRCAAEQDEWIALPSRLTLTGPRMYLAGSFCVSARDEADFSVPLQPHVQHVVVRFASRS